ncbi:MAG: hypothetical protein PUF61_14065 [Spirochaetales bacterium]|nr:hypothetical protein [Spirochaetales bacterium]
MKQINEFKKNAVDIFVIEILVLLLFILQFQVWNKNFHVPYFTTGDDFWRNSIFYNVISGSKWFISYNTQFPFGGVEIIPLEGYFNQWIQICTAKIFKNIGYVSWFFLYFTYSLTALLTFLSLRVLDIKRITALVGAILYDFIPYHFYRIVHWNLLSYYTLPVLLSMCLLLSKYAIENKEYTELSYSEKKWLFFCFLNSLILGMSSIYYLLFVSFCISFSLIFGIINKNKVSVFSSLLSIFLLYLGMIICVAYGNYLKAYAENNIQINLPASSNSFFYTSGTRTLWDIAAYQLPVVDLFLPFRSIIPWVEQIAKIIHQRNVFVLEDNFMAILGFPLSMSLIVSILFLFKNNKDNLILHLCSKYNLVLIFFSTTLGLSLFVGLLTTGIRSYNRFSIFIAFFCVIFLCLFVDTYFSSNKKFYWFIMFVIFITGLITEISPKDGKYLGLAVYDGYAYCDEYTQIEATYKECEEIISFIEETKTGARIAFWNIKDAKNIYISALSKNSYFNLPKSNYEYENFWQKQKDLNVNERLDNLYHLGYDYIILSDFTENFVSDGNSLEELLGVPVKTTTHIKIYKLNNSNNIDIETAKERFYEFYNKQ